VCNRIQNVQYYAHRVALLDRDVCMETLTAHFDRQSITRTGKTRMTFYSPHHCVVITRKPNTKLPYLTAIYTVHRVLQHHLLTSF